MDEAQRVFALDLRRAEQLRASLREHADGRADGADALVIVTEWKEFRSPDFERIKATLKTPVIFDGRNLYEPEAMAELGIDYHAIGRPHDSNSTAPAMTAHPSASTRRCPQCRAPSSAARVLVVGDVMLDRYWFGDVNRISPEAPVPVVRSCSARKTASAARPTSRATRRRSARRPACSPWSATTSRASASSSLLGESGVDSVPRTRSATPHHDQAARASAPAAAAAHRLRERADARGAASQARAVSTTCCPQHDVDPDVRLRQGRPDARRADDRRRARAAGKPVLVDPKGDDWTRYRGATLITPNRAELREVVGQLEDRRGSGASARRSCARELRLRRAAADALGRGHDALHRRRRAAHRTPRRAKCIDVSGAGDTVIATLAAMLGAGVPLDATRSPYRQPGGGHRRRQARHGDRRLQRTLRLRSS